MHGSYLRFPADLPVAGRRVVLRLRVRRFTCDAAVVPGLVGHHLVVPVADPGDVGDQQRVGSGGRGGGVPDGGHCSCGTSTAPPGRPRPGW
ncbi:transposase family protein [Kitasatospora paracochleata]|uniref:transposase family protein n=1 Tax=Kitasatospora paracochleata TaxID=58354 RepID=UPI0038991AFB